MKRLAVSKQVAPRQQGVMLVQLRLSPFRYERLKTRAEKANVSMNRYVGRLILRDKDVAPVADKVSVA